MKISKILFSLSLFCAFNSYSQSITIHSITNSRMNGGDHGYTLNGSHMLGYSTSKLTSASNFGPSGTYPKTISIVNSYGNYNDLAAITSTTGIDLFFFGTFDNNNSSIIPFSSWEIDSLHKWSMNGGKMIIAGAASNTPGYNFDFNILDTKWGYNIAYEAGSVVNPNTTGLATSIFDGPFGSVTLAYQGGFIVGYFDSIPNNAIVLAENGSSSDPTLILDCTTLDLIVADGDAYTDLGGVTSGAGISSINDRFWANTIAYMDSLQGQPQISLSGITLSTGVYSSYQWFKNGTAIPGATSSFYTMSTDGVYHVEVNLDCGCNNVPSKEINIVNLGLNESGRNIAELSVYPNPVSESSVVSLHLNQSENVSIGIYDLNGREIKNLYSGELSYGKHQFNLNLFSDIESLVQNGVYFVQIRAASLFASKKIVVLK